MKKIIMLLSVLPAMFTAGLAETTGPAVVEKGAKTSTRQKQARKRDEYELRVVPHMAVNNDFTSELTIRSDSDVVINVELEFYGPTGDAVETTFLDSLGYEYTLGPLDVFVIELQPFEIYSMNFGTLIGGRNMQAFVFTEISPDQTAYSLEVVYHRFFGARKVASVGVPVVPPGDIFIMNLDQRFDPDTLNRKFRGLAVSNNDGLDCRCDVTLFNQDGNSFDAFGDYPIVSLDIPANGKWVGTVYDLYPDINDLLLDGMGYFIFECDNLVSALGLAFEESTPVAASVPIDYFVFTKTKDGVKRIRRAR